MADFCAYLLVAWLRNQGRCQCGWIGKHRLLRGSAVLDVLAHCSDTGHVPQGTLPPVRPVIHTI